MKRIAVIGGGVSGIVASYLLDEEYDVTLYEKNDYIGGHTHTITVNPTLPLNVDTGFIVYNERTYPNFIKFLNELGVMTQESDMSFSYYDEFSGRHYAGTGVNGLFSTRKHMIKPAFHRMLLDIYRFGKKAIEDLDEGRIGFQSLGDYVNQKRYSSTFVEEYLKPMGAAIWSTPAGSILDFPARNFLVFFRNHGLLELRNRPTWRTVQGGSQRYVDAFLKVFKGKILMNAEVTGVRRASSCVWIHTQDGEQECYDMVVMASHADQSYRMLLDPTEDEDKYLGIWQYSTNRTVLHTDVDVMPPVRRAWASWNYLKEKESKADGLVSLTYHMNRLQRLAVDKDYFVTLNRTKEIESKDTIRTFIYEHPVYTQESVESQEHLKRMSGVNRTYYCGSYFNYGFHEDAVTSAVEVAESLGIKPWTKKEV